MQLDIITVRARQVNNAFGLCFNEVMAFLYGPQNFQFWR